MVRTDATCGSNDHAGYGAGTVYRGDANTNIGAMYMNGCSHVGGCSNGEGDTIAFSTHVQWADVTTGGWCFGGCCCQGASPSAWDLT